MEQIRTAIKRREIKNSEGEFIWELQNSFELSFYKKPTNSNVFINFYGSILNDYSEFWRPKYRHF